MARNTLHPNLISQLEVFRAVAETGSFSAAAARLGRAVSAVSYAIANLEQHLDVALFDRSGYRPNLTEEGRALLTDAEIVFRRLDRLNARVGAMKAEQEVELTLSVDTSFDRALLARALARLDEEIPHLDYRLHTAIDREAWGAVMRAECQLALVELNAGMPAKDLDGREVAVYSLGIAAAPGHPLARRNEPIPLSALDDHRQIVVASHLTDRQDFDYRFHGTDILIADSTEMALSMLRAGLGWAYIPAPTLLEEEEAGRLVEIPCADIAHPSTSRFAALWRVKAPPGPAARRFLDILVEEAG